MSRVRWLAALTVVLLAIGGCSETSVVRPPRTDVLYQDPPAEVDILLVVDNSLSMEDEQTKLSAGFEDFVEYFVVANVEYHIGVTTTDIQVGAGRLQSSGGYTYVTPNTPSAGDVFRDLVQVGISGSGYELGMEAALMALTEPNRSGANVGFFREEALLSVVFVSDEDDGSPWPVADYVNDLRDLKGQRRRDALNASALAGIDEATGLPTDCDLVPDNDIQGARAAWRYWDVAAESGGTVADICAEDYGDAIRSMGLTSSRLRDTFELSRRADEDTIELTIFESGDEGEGLEVPPEGAEGSYPWEYLEDDDVAFGLIRFVDPADLPPTGAMIVVRYELAGAA